MTSNLPALPVASQAPSLGEGYWIQCPSCQSHNPPIRRGRCQDCLEPLALPSLPTLEDRIPPAWAEPFAHAKTGLFYLSGWAMQAPWTFAFFWGGLLSGLSLSSPSFLFLLVWGIFVDQRFGPTLKAPEPLRIQRIPAELSQAEAAGDTVRPKVFETYSTQVEIRDATASLALIRKRRGFRVQIDLELKHLQGEALDLELRVLGPDERYLKARLPSYRGPHGEVFSQHRAARLRLDHSHFPDLWIYLPLRALGMPSYVTRVEVQLEASLAVRGRRLARLLIPAQVLPRPEELWEPEAQVEADEDILLLEGKEGLEGVNCLVCGDELDGQSLRCPVCSAPHHRECWDYLDGCSRFGCSESPTRKAH